MTTNTFESIDGGITVSGRAHSSRAWFVLALRLMMGAAFTYAGMEKIPNPFDEKGYLVGATVANGSPIADLFVAMGTTPWFVTVVNVAIPWG